MTRNRHKKNRIKEASSGFKSPTLNYTPAAQAVVKRITSGGVDYLMKNLIPIMTKSAKLVEEPEFIDLSLDGRKAAEITQKWLKKYDKRLSAARMKDSNKFQAVFDEMRIEIIAELATPAFRRDVDQRLQAMLNRLSASEDLDKLEMVLLLKPLLSMKEVPWGLCGLIISIYNRTMRQTIQDYGDEESIYQTVLEAFKSEGVENFDVTDALKSPEKLEQIGQKLFGEKPGLRERAEKQIFDMEDAFEKELAGGKIKLDLFTETELVLPLERLQAEMSEGLLHEKPSAETQQRVIDAMVQGINEMMTPERFQRLRKEVEAMSKTWLRERNKWSAALLGELAWLEGDQYEENKFVLSAFFGQLKRLGDEQPPAGKQKKHGHKH